MNAHLSLFLARILDNLFMTMWPQMRFLAQNATEAICGGRDPSLGTRCKSLQRSPMLQILSWIYGVRDPGERMKKGKKKGQEEKKKRARKDGEKSRGVETSPQSNF